MLTRQWTIADYDFARGRVTPDRLTQLSHRPYLDLAQRALDVYRCGVGQTRRELHRRIEVTFSREPDCSLRRIGAFCKLLDDASQYDRRARRQAASLRCDVFRRAAKLHPLVAQADRQFPNHELHAKAAIARELGTSWPEIDQRLFADVIELERLLHFDGYADGGDLLARYNVAQVQAVLFDAVALDVEAGADFKTILRYAKLARLMHTIERREGGGYEMHFDGPASLLRNTRRYGVAMARFLPALVACRDWRMRAAIQHRGQRLQFDLAATDGLHSHLPAPKTFDSRLEQSFAEAWGDAARDGWRLERESEVLHREQKVFIPDFTLRHDDGRRVLLEIVGFWTPEYLQAKVETLRIFAGQQILLAVAESLQDQLPDMGKTIVYRKALSVDDVLARLCRL